MVAELQREVAQALRSGVSLTTIERTIIDRAPLDEEQRAALWLYAEALRDRSTGPIRDTAWPPLPGS
jgi:hypothetical protein